MRNVAGSSQALIQRQRLEADYERLSSDLQKTFTDDREYVTRPKLLYTLAATIGGTAAMAYFNGTDTVMHLSMKAIYAAVAQIVGVNVGLAMDSEVADNAVFAGSYYLMNSMSSGLRGYNSNAGTEAIVGALIGYATNYYMGQGAPGATKVSHQGPSKCHC